MHGFAREEPAQLVGEIARGGVPLALDAPHRPLDDRLELGGRGGAGLPQRRRFGRQDLHEDIGDGFAVERPLSAQEHVERGRQRIDVAPLVHLAGPSRRLLGRHERRGPEDRAADRGVALGGRELGQPEVHDVEASLGVDHQVLGLEVAVDDAPLVGVGDGAGGIAHGGDGLGDRKARALEARAVHELHRDVRPPLGLSHLVDMNDAWMVELGGILRFLAKTRHLDRRCELSR